MAIAIYISKITHLQPYNIDNQPEKICGSVSISGSDNGEVVKFFAIDGKYLDSTISLNGAASYAVSESLVVAKMGRDSIKIAMK